MKEQVEHNGQTYTRIKGKWYDKNHMAVPHLQKKLDELYESQRNLDDFTLEELVAEGDRFKAAESWHIAIRYYDRALEVTQNVQTFRLVLPRITSCYRAQGRAKDAIALYDSLTGMYRNRLASPALLTSIAAAYCDIRDFRKAEEYAKWAYAASHGKSSPELNGVFGRIRKELTGSGKYEE